MGLHNHVAVAIFQDENADNALLDPTRDVVRRNPSPRTWAFLNAVILLVFSEMQKQRINHGVAHSSVRCLHCASLSPERHRYLRGRLL